MKISFIICYSSTTPMTIFDKKSWPKPNIELDKAILKATNKLLSQIIEIDLYKEILLLDNSGDFKTDIVSDQLKIINTYKEVKKDLEIKNQAQVTAEAYNIGLFNATGNYIIIQHNDTEYLNEYYPTRDFLLDAIDKLNGEKYGYITVDAKPSKSGNPENNFYADCYWFLCNGTFYADHRINVDYKNGDNNHLATITCREKQIKYLHLPGYYEIGLGEHHKMMLKKDYPGLFRSPYNIHTYNGIPFLKHYKGGTGLKRLIRE